MLYEKIHFFINDQEHIIDDVAPTTTLLNYLRSNHQTGTKEGCAEGDCGACTVIVLDVEKQSYQAINACLLLLPMLQGKLIYTVEGITQHPKPKEIKDLHPVQQAMVRHSATQCGYCTPGFVMSLFEAYYRQDLKEEWQLDDQLAGNLCRCTGYRSIYEALKEVVNLTPPPQDIFTQQLAQTNSLCDAEYTDACVSEGACEIDQSKANPQLAMIRDRLMTAYRVSQYSLHYRYQHQSFSFPKSLNDLFSAWFQYPQAKILAGGTDLNLMITKRFQAPEALISIDHIKALKQVESHHSAVRLGAAIALSQLEKIAQQEGFLSLERMLRYFAAHQIKNRGSLGGNLANASPIGDLAPILLALDAKLILISGQKNEQGEIEMKERTIALEDFFLDYRKTALTPFEIIAYIVLPRKIESLSDPQNHAPRTAYAKAYKVSKRQELDISIVSCGAYVELEAQDQEQAIVTQIRLFFGGMAATPKRAKHAEACLLGKAWSIQSIENAMDALALDFQPLTDHRGSSWYRMQVAKNILLGFYEEKPDAQRLIPRPSSTFLLS
jgi:xanthine dehydrogenase small subunit